MALPELPRIRKRVLLRVRVRGAVALAKLLLVYKVLPSGAEVDLDSMAESIKAALPGGVSVRGHSKEPLAFGIHYLKLQLVMDDAGGLLEGTESAVRGVEGVSEMEILQQSRMSVDMK